MLHVQDYSTHGTWVNGFRVQKGQRHRVVQGDVLSLGPLADGGAGAGKNCYGTQFRVDNATGSASLPERDEPSTSGSSSFQERTSSSSFTRQDTPDTKRHADAADLEMTPSPVCAKRRRTNSQVMGQECRNLGLEFEEVDGRKSCTQSTSDQVGLLSRVKVTMMLCEVLLGPDIAVAAIPAKVEAALFRHYGSASDPRYHKHAQMLKAFLSLARNTQLGGWQIRRRIVSGQLCPETLLQMSSKQLMSFEFMEQQCNVSCQPTRLVEVTSNVAGAAAVVSVVRAEQHSCSEQT